MNLLQVMRRITRKEHETRMDEQKRGFRHVTLNENREIHCLYGRGHSMVEIAQLLHRSPATIQRQLKKDGPTLKRFIEEQRAQTRESGLDTSRDAGHFSAGHWVGQGDEPHW